ncbi:LysE family translocator [Ornithobacterium rhinotracheale]|uniref:LysE family translocator n=1 Tax=Ornithobacterium rhinotracheale TaxID=28251 RepID=UPI0039A638F7
MEFVVYAILLGIMLSLVLIGPAFFLLIETSITKGWRSAIALDAGVVSADLLCIAFAYTGVGGIVEYIGEHPALYKIGGFIIMIYGGIMYLSKPKLHIKNTKIVGKNYLKTFVNGFLMNILNIGVVSFWFVVAGWITIKYPGGYNFTLFIAIAILTFLAIDLSKIFLAHKFQDRLTDALVYKIRKWIGVVLFIFGFIILLKGFISFQPIEDALPALPFHE